MSTLTTFHWLKATGMCLSVGVLSLLSACTTVGPDYVQPAADVAASWQAENDRIKTSPVRNGLWWQSLNDPVLDQLIELGYQHNLSLQSTGVNVIRARAQLGQAVGGLYPQQQGVGGSYTSQDFGENSMYTDAIPTTVDVASLTASASWEIDFWGKYRRAIRAHNATFLSSIDAYNDALVSLTADIGSRYVSIRTLQVKRGVIEDSITLYKEITRIVQTEYEAGQASFDQVTEAIQAQKEAEAGLPSVKTSLQQEKDALAVLIGTTPDGVEAVLAAGAVVVPVAPDSIAVGIPKDVLRQRPDVQEAELQAMAASEDIGAIKAELYPAFTLNGSFGYNSSNIGSSSPGDLFQSNNSTSSTGPSLYLPLFNYGQVTNKVRDQDAAFQQAILNYQNVVLKAQQEVQDGIVGYVESAETLALMQSANEAALAHLALTLVRYQSGEDSYSTLLDAAKQQLSVQSSYVDAQGDVPLNLISLYRALGGGWEARGQRDVVSDETKQQMADRVNWGDLLDTAQHEAPDGKKEALKQTVLPSW